MREAIRADRREQIIISNQRFHDVIYSAAGNPMLARVASDLRDFVRRFTTLPFATPDRVDRVLGEHEQILAALEAHDPEAAQQASNAHLDAAREYLVRLDLEAFAEHALR